jgi:hypothetical protein
MVAELRKAAEADPDYPPVLLVHQGTAAEGAAFFATFWPEARAVSDEENVLYPAFGVDRAGFLQIFGPGAAACSLRAAAKGYLPGKTVGDPWLLPGLFLVRGERVLWQHDFAHIGDHPDFARLPARWVGLAVDQRQVA